MFNQMKNILVLEPHTTTKDNQKNLGDNHITFMFEIFNVDLLF